MIRSFRDTGTEDIYHASNSKKSRKALPRELIGKAQDKLDMINAAFNLNDLESPPGNKLEALKGDRLGQYSIRVNDQYRIAFKWDNNGASDVEIVDYH
jgi:toxin HigB-1